MQMEICVVTKSSDRVISLFSESVWQSLKKYFSVSSKCRTELTWVTSWGLINQSESEITCHIMRETSHWSSNEK